MNNEIPCKICGYPTGIRFNIDFVPVPVCEECAATIFMQQAQWYTEQAGDMVPKATYEEAGVQIGKLQEEVKNLRHTLREIM